MFAQTQYRPEIARVAEETVLNLKQLESRIDVLKNDLAALCTVLGHPEAARIAVTPPSWLGITPHPGAGTIGVQGLGNFGSFGATPFQGGTPSASPVPPWTQGLGPQTPWPSPTMTPYGAPIGYGPGFGVGSVPYGTYGNPASQVYPPLR